MFQKKGGLFFSLKNRVEELYPIRFGVLSFNLIDNLIN